MANVRKYVRSFFYFVFHLLKKFHVNFSFQFSCPFFPDSLRRKVKRYWKLDNWEDDCRRRRRLVPNPYGTSHGEAVLRQTVPPAADEIPLEDAMQQAEEPLHAKLASLGFGHREVPLEVGEDIDSNSEELEMEYSTSNKGVGKITLYPFFLVCSTF